MRKIVTTNSPTINIFIALLFMTIILCACAMAAQSPGVEYQSIDSSAAEFSKETAMDVNTESGVAPNRYAIADSTQDVQRIVIKNAQLSIIVENPSSSFHTISNLAEEMDGYVVSGNLYYSRLSSGADVPRGSITIRIPAELLDDALSQIESLSNRPPQNKTIESQDVTREYTNLQSRLRNLEDAEEQLRIIMDNAYSTEDVLNVYNELVSVREQIEVIKGQIQYYEQADALSSIRVELIADEAVQPLQIGGWQPVGVAKNAVEALIGGLKFLGNAAIWIIIFVAPILLILYLVLALPLTFFLRKLKQRRAQRKVQQIQSKSSPEQAPDPAKSEE
jgi:hypothetical protein